MSNDDDMDELISEEKAAKILERIDQLAAGNLERRLQQTIDDFRENNPHSGSEIVPCACLIVFCRALIADSLVRNIGIEGSIEDAQYFVANAVRIYWDEVKKGFVDENDKGKNEE